MMMKKILAYSIVISLWSICVSTVAYSQSIDSLQQMLREYPHKDRKKVTILTTLSSSFRNDNKDEMLKYARQGLQLSAEIQDSFHVAHLENNVGLYYMAENEYKEATKYFISAINNAETRKDTAFANVVRNNVGILYILLGNYAKAFETHQILYDYARQKNDPHTLLLAIVNLSEDLLIANDLDQALMYNQLAEEELQKIDLNNKLLELEAQMSIEYRYSTIYLQKQNYKNTKLHLDKGIALGLDKLPNSQYLGGLYGIQGEMFLNQKQYEKAEQSYSKGYKLALLGPKANRMTYEVKFSTIALIKKQYSEALDWAFEALKLQQENILSHKASLEAYHNIATVYAELGDYKQADFYQQKQIALQKKVNDIDTSHEFALLHIINQSKEKQAENTALKAKKKAQQQQIREKNIGIIASLGVLTLSIWIAIFFFRTNRKRKKQNNQLDELARQQTKDIEKTIQNLASKNEELERFSYTASHDLKEPLRNIHGFIGLVEAETKEGLTPRLQQHFTAIKEETVHMQVLVQDILAYIQVSTKNSEIEPVDLQEVFHTAVKEMQAILQRKNADVRTRGKLPVVMGQRVDLEYLFKQIIANGIEHNSDTIPTVEISYESHNNWHHLYFADNGNGIAVEQREKLFQLSTTEEEELSYTTQHTTSIGLALCRKAVQKLNGGIEIESEIGKGSMFVIWFPENRPTFIPNKTPTL